MTRPHQATACAGSPVARSGWATTNAYLEEAPAHAVAVSGFWIDAYVVTNANFAAFVTATGYCTVAERPLDPAAYPGADPSLLTPGSSVFFMPTGTREHGRHSQ